MSQEEKLDREILEELTALIGDDGGQPASSKPSAPAAPPPPPTVGTYVQRSDKETAKK